MKLTWSPLTLINILCCKCLPPIIKMLYGSQRRFGVRLMKFLWVRTAVRLTILRNVFLHAAPNIAKTGLFTVGAAFAHAARDSGCDRLPPSSCDSTNNTNVTCDTGISDLLRTTTASASFIIKL